RRPGGRPPAAAPVAAPPAVVRPTKVADPAADARKSEVEDQVHALTESLDDGKGAPWEDIVAEAAKRKVTEAEVEEALNSLMDKGLIYEPVLGRLKRT
ncbi:MAG TPA: hypothetical protein VM889_00485, partial [Candidatus Thermoplasmatota archaeon]|nr:hypothetical protein [Candidatus Thermoplasmatota archaeon]